MAERIWLAAGLFAALVVVVYAAARWNLRWVCRDGYPHWRKECDGHDHAVEDRLPDRDAHVVLLPAEVPAAPEGVVALVPEDALDPEPGEEYADELHRINLEARADSWRYDSLAILTRMPRHWITYGYTGDDWLRCNLPHAEYMAELEREHLAYMKAWGREQAADKAKQLRGIRRYRGLGAAA